MRLILLFVGALLCSSFANPSKSVAASYPWCAYYGMDFGGVNCGFSTYEQCMAALSGNGGYCGTNTQYQPSAGAYSPRRAHRSN
jgi:hypothetical protein